MLDVSILRIFFLSFFSSFRFISEGVKGVDAADELRLHPLEELPSFLSLFQRSAHPNAIKEVEKILSLYV